MRARVLLLRAAVVVAELSFLSDAPAEEAAAPVGDEVTFRFEGLLKCPLGGDVVASLERRDRFLFVTAVRGDRSPRDDVDLGLPRREGRT